MLLFSCPIRLPPSLLLLPPPLILRAIRSPFIISSLSSACHEDARGSAIDGGVAALGICAVGS